MPRCPRDFDRTGGHSGVHLSLWGHVWGSISLAELCVRHMRDHSSLTQLRELRAESLPRGASSSQSSPFLLPCAIMALFSATMTQSDLHPLLKYPFQGR